METKEESKTPLWDAVMDRMQKFDKLSDLKEFHHETNPVQHNLIGHQMLLTWRNYVIKIIKDPLRYAIVKAKTAKDLIKPLMAANGKFLAKMELKKGNTIYLNTHTLMDNKKKFLLYEDNPKRAKMFEAAYNVLIFEYEHDPYYHFRFDWVVEKIVEAILLGEWMPRPEGFPQRNADRPKAKHSHWKEPTPYGGGYSIVTKLRDKRNEVLKVLGMTEEDLKL